MLSRGPYWMCCVVSWLSCLLGSHEWFDLIVLADPEVAVEHVSQVCESCRRTRVIVR